MKHEAFIPNRRMLQDWIKRLEDACPYKLDDGQEDAGFTYIIECGGLYKIGHTTDIARRISAFQVANVKPVRLVCYWISLCPDVLECELHVHFQHRNIRGEWYALTRDEITVLVDWAAKQSIPTYTGDDREKREDKLSPRSVYRRSQF